MMLMKNGFLHKLLVADFWGGQNAHFLGNQSIGYKYQMVVFELIELGGPRVFKNVPRGTGTG